MRKRFVALGGAVAIVAASYAAMAATPAGATTQVTASTSVTNHPDTTAAAGPGACTASAGGNVWAHDFYTSTITVTADTSPANTYSVAITDTGKYSAFADPTTCAAQLSTGALSGTYDLTVTSPSAPVAADLKANYDGAVSTTTMVDDLFNNQETNVVGGDYNFSYQGGNYIQNTAGSTGDVTAVTPVITISNVANQTNTVGKSIAGLQVSASSNYPDDALAFTATNLPAGLSISNTGLITGTPTKVENYNPVTVKVAGSKGETAASNEFSWDVTAVTAPPPAETYSNPFVMRNGYSGKCLNDASGHHVAGDTMNQYTCGANWFGFAGGAQKFRYDTLADGTQYLEALSPSGAPLSTPLYVQATTQGVALSLTTTPAPYVWAANVFSWHGLTADDARFSKSNGTVIWGWPKTGNSNQRWLLLAA